MWATPHWGLQTELMYERSDLGEKPMVIEIRAGVQHMLPSGARLALGGTFIHTSPYGPFPSRVAFQEYRTWQQAQIDQKLGVVSLAHRYRLEERWIIRPVSSAISATDETDPSYTLRFRYQIRGSVPLTKPSAPHSLYAVGSEEVFVGAGPHTPLNVLDQNRASIGLGLRWSPALRTEAGYLSHVVLRGNGTQVENNHTLLVTIGVTRAAPKR